MINEAYSQVCVDAPFQQWVVVSPETRQVACNSNHTCLGIGSTECNGTTE